MTTDERELDVRIRAFIYEVTTHTGHPPHIAAIARSLSLTVGEVAAAMSRLATAHELVLEPQSGEVLMANPFSAVPTPFRVESEGISSYGNCILDALGIPAMLHQDATIVTSCGDCGASEEISVGEGGARGNGVLHFAIPARGWWNDIVFA